MLETLPELVLVRLTLLLTFQDIIQLAQTNPYISTVIKKRVETAVRLLREWEEIKRQTAQTEVEDYLAFSTLRVLN